MNLSPPALLLYSVVLAFFSIYVPFLVVGYARAQVGYDRSAPRTMLERLPAYAQRANWAHQNSFESFMVYSAAALMAYLTGVNGALSAIAAIAFPLARLLYSVFYILDIPLARSLMFGIGTFSSLTLFFLSLRQVNP
jgi:uncharacterized MAPEG superfamily protein